MGAGRVVYEAAQAQQAELLALRARVARLEEALKEISTLYWVDAPAPEEMRRIARRALEEKCTLTDSELLDAMQKLVSKLCDTGGRAWTLSVPVNFDRDQDMLITELCKRHNALLVRHNALVEAVAWEREFDEVLVWLVRTGRYPRDMASRYDLANERECARAEVDRLIEEGE